ncbi:MAG TPA: VOC family protein [Planctomycetaceae bacterium]|nr:VOC family protein [Planctomycetaceae bacterium]
MQVNPYVFFEGRCEEALEFYKKAVGAKVTFQHRYKDSPDPLPPGAVAPGWESKIMHATFTIGQSTLHASDGRGQGKVSHQGFSLSLTVPTPAEADRCFAALADQGQVEMPLSKTFFSPRFGMLTDRFGVGWMVYVAP